MKTINIFFALIILFVGANAQKATPNRSYKEPVLNEKYMKRLGLENSTFSLKSAGVWTCSGGITVYSSHPYGNDIKGYNGATPLFIAVSKNGVINSVAAAVNTESPMYWKKVSDSHLFKAWNGMKLKKAASKEVDAVSGATASSTAVIKTVQATAKSVAK